MDKKKIEYGKVSIPPEKFHPKNVKVRVTMFVDADVVQAFKLAAASQRKGYQTLMNERLREITETGVNRPLLERVKDLEDQMRVLRRRPVKMAR